MRVAELRAPAKVNLGLRICGRRDDGYHTLESLFAPLDLADEVRVELAACEPGDPRDSRISLDVSGLGASELPRDDRNLAVCAARAFAERAGLRLDAKISIAKAIPAGAGLGGGSSDAAAVLRALASLAPTALAGAELRAAALSLGADVPFFLDPRPAQVAGIGDRIEPVAGLGALPLALAHPGISLSTAEVYAAWDRSAGALTPPTRRPTMPPVFGPGVAVETFARLFVGGVFVGANADRSRLSALLANDLYAPAASLCQPIVRLHEQLESLGALAVGMSGSGSAMFGLFESRSRAEAAVASHAFASPAWVRAANTLASA